MLRARPEPPPLPPHWFQILLALADRDLHGLGVMHEVLERTGGHMRLWPGMLYRNLERLVTEALVVEIDPPACEYWMIALHNHWMETLDYVHHQATLNCHTAQLDTAGHHRGTVGVRWVGPDVIDVLPSTRVVKVSELAT